jgi:hypothetical protein
MGKGRPVRFQVLMDGVTRAVLERLAVQQSCSRGLVIRQGILLLDQLAYRGGLPVLRSGAQEPVRDRPVEGGEVEPPGLT